MKNKLLKILIPAAVFLVTACSPAGNSKVKIFYENSTRSEIESIDAKKIVRLTNGCAAFFVENAAGKTILSTARHCVSYNPTEWCNVKDSFTDNEGNIGQCKKIHIDGPEGDIILFEADFPHAVAPENTFRLAGYVPELESELVMLGYPADLYRNGRPTRTENCKVLSGEKPSVYGDRGNEGGNHRMVAHNCTTYGGNSGGPMFIKGTRDVVGQPATYTPAIANVYPPSFIFGHVNLSSQIVENYRPLLDELKIAISSAPEPIVLAADPVLSEDERDFSSYCSKTDLSPGETASRDALLSLAGTNDCVQATYKLSRITELSFQARNLTDFRFLGFKIFHTNLVGLYLGGTKIQSLPELEYLKNLKYLDLSNTGFSDLRSLGSLTKLNYLLLSGNNLESLAGLPDLSNHSQLYNVELSRNSLSDVSTLATLPAFKTLINLEAPIENIATLYLNENKGDLRSLVDSLNNVRPDILYLQSSNINDLSTLLPVLSLVYTLSLGDNKISDLTPLKDVAGSATIQNIDLQLNPIQDITPITHLPELRSINFVAIPDSAIKPLEGLKFLETLDLSAPLEGERICPYKEKENICVWSDFRFDWSAAATQ